jgi:glycosyltransferase involved in cell wall biosynthesis
VIINTPGWTRDLAEGNDCGVYVPSGDGRALADAVEKLADDRGAMARMGANARALAEREFSRDDLAARMLDVLEKARGTAGR